MHMLSVQKRQHDDDAHAAVYLSHAEPSQVAMRLCVGGVQVGCQGALCLGSQGLVCSLP